MASAVLYLLHPDADRELLSKAISAMTHILTCGQWELRATAIALHEGLIAQQPEMLHTMGKLLHSNRDNYEARLALDPVIAALRQVSRAPVQHHGDQLLWFPKD
jgi:hypothetical protein